MKQRDIARFFGAAKSLRQNRAASIQAPQPVLECSPIGG
ncbi:hypothetical protein LPU83_pLPU83b_0266 (plasmid) [Rhizobium favelukesii]|uniref:Uncharacterized protein n=1 Tax=Rhizobium favelukesii TaxID=348824 RepID=W6S1B5_9HYPH|nr:hypothetical protein LPU83_pLPU83b_0266 [Rhizobium favelukesii]